MKLARTENAFRNMLWGAVYRMLAIIGPFVIKTIIIKNISMEYSGLNTLFNSILTVLNLANLGFSSSLVYTMYAAVAKEDHTAICAMMNFFRKIYRLIGAVILGMGLVVMPFLPQLVGNECPPDANLYVMWALYLSATVLDYLLFGYVNAIFSAYQREDSRLKIMVVRYAVQYAVQILILAVFKNYYAYLVTLPLFVIPNGVALYYLAKKQYPQIRCVGDPDKQSKRSIYYRVKTLFGHKVGNTLMVNADSILISSFLGLSTQALYSNYYYIITAVNGVVEIITTGCLAGIGNKLIVDSEEENHNLFLSLTYGWVALIGFCAVCMLCLFQPFVGGIWIGAEGLLNEEFIICITLFFYAWMFRIMQLTYRDAAGLWTRDWLKPYVSMFLKLVLSVLMVKLLGSITGVLLPTILIMLLVYFPWEAKVLYRHLFRRSWLVYLKYIVWYSSINLAGAVLCRGICLQFFPGNTAATFFLRLVVVCAVFPALWLLLTHRSAQFKQLLRITKQFINKKRAK